MMCFSGNCQVSDDPDAWVYCAECNRYFKTQECYENHKKQGSSIRRFGNICAQYYKCAKCERVVNKKLIRKGKEHDCTDMWCRVCQGNYPIGHKCFIKPLKDDTVEEDTNEKAEAKEKEKIGKEDKTFCYIFFDFESQQETGIHKPNLCVAQKVCDTCHCRPLEEPCDVCGDDREIIFEGTDCVNDFCLWLFNDERHKNARCLAHNLKGYDGYFILQFLYDNAIKPNIIMNGGKIMSITVPGSKIRLQRQSQLLPYVAFQASKVLRARE